MDSLTQLALGAAVGIGVMGRRTAVWKAALWGGVCGTLPDLDAFIDHGDPISNMTYHRAESHALFWLSLASPFIAALIARVHGEWDRVRRWWLAVWLALVTHPLLDAMTVYGTQLALPFTDHPFAVGSIFIIDPVYTLPLIAGVAVALVRRDGRGARWNTAALVFSTAYLGWSVLAQQHVANVAAQSLAEQGVQAERVLVTPAPFNTVLWRVVAMERDGYREGHYSLLDDGRRIAFDRFPRHAALQAESNGNRHAERLAWFSRGFYAWREQDGELRITDLRMGQEPTYTFSFTVAERRDGRMQPVTPVHHGMRPDIARALPWLWRRMLGEPLAPPR